MTIIYDPASLREKTRKALADDFKHEAIKTAQDVITGKRDALVQEATEWDDMRDHAAAIRDHVLANLDYYVKEFATNAQAAGAKVYFAPTGKDAVEQVLKIFREKDADFCVKAKSMVSEEIGMNETLAEHGITAIETDCAENILQTAGDPPSHIVVPALHLERKGIRDLYRREKGYQGTHDPEEITHFLRKTLREDFLRARIGVTGCNFGVASTGSCTLVTNEGNGRMVTTAPKTQIVLMGMERIVPDLASLDVMINLLVRSAVGAKITSSFSINTGPRKAGEIDGPAEVHIIMVNNGRSDILSSKYREMLRCIRCGACMNTCPVYRHITGHGYGSIYPGPMGVVLTPLLTDYQAANGITDACTLCGACADVCPVKIPLNELILEHRQDYVASGHAPKGQKLVFEAASTMMKHRSLYNTATRIGSFAMRAVTRQGRVGKAAAWMPIYGNLARSRDLLPLTEKRFSEQFAEHKQQQAQKQAVGQGPVEQMSAKMPGVEGVDVSTQAGGQSASGADSADSGAETKDRGK